MSTRHPYNSEYYIARDVLGFTGEAGDQGTPIEGAKVTVDWVDKASGESADATLFPLTLTEESPGRYTAPIPYDKANDGTKFTGKIKIVAPDGTQYSSTEQVEIQQRKV